MGGGVWPYIPEFRVMALIAIMTGVTGYGTTLYAEPGMVPWTLMDFFIGLTTLSVFIPIVELQAT